MCLVSTNRVTNVKIRYWYSAWCKRVSIVIRSFTFSLFAGTFFFLDAVLAGICAKNATKDFHQWAEVIWVFSFPVCIRVREYVVLRVLARCSAGIPDIIRIFWNFSGRLSLDRISFGFHRGIHLLKFVEQSRKGINLPF